LGGSPPENAYEGTIGSFVAKATESARMEAEDPLMAAMEAWYFATSAAATAHEERLVDALTEDFVKLHRTAVRGQWTDRTKIPPEIWSML
jgi:hypothetical protein